jgi:hypothetical protein
MRRVGLSLASLSDRLHASSYTADDRMALPALRLDAAVEVATPAMLGREGVEVGQHAHGPRA